MISHIHKCIFIHIPRTAGTSIESALGHLDNYKGGRGRQDHRPIRMIEQPFPSKHVFTSFDIVHSNSLIEHVNTLGKQKNIADEIMRIGKNYFVQTPNYYFPVEPHFLFIGFQWLPIKIRAFLLRNFKLTFGRRKKIKNYSKSLEVADSIRLLKKKEFRSLFPGAKIYIEKFFMLEKSFVLYKLPHRDNKYM